MDIDLRKLNHLVTVARTGSFSKAAEALHITQPALSRSIASVEAHFGIKIFDRSRSGSALTAVGSLVITEAEALLRKARSLDHNLKLYGGGHAGKIAFGMGPLIASLVLPSLSSHFLNQQLRLHIRAAVKPAEALCQELYDDQIELLFYGNGQMEVPSNLSVDIVGHIPLATLVRANHPLTRYKTISQEDLLEYPTLGAIESLDIKSGGAGGSFICDNFDILRQSVLSSDGVWISSPQLVVKEIKQGAIVTINVTDMRRPSQVEVCMARIQGRKTSPAAETITAYVRGYLNA